MNTGEVIIINEIHREPLKHMTVKTDLLQGIPYDEFCRIKDEAQIPWTEMVQVHKQDAPAGLVIMIDEEGKLNRKEYNPIATDLYHSEWDVIVGRAVVMREDGENLIPLTDADVTYLEDLWKHTQAHREWIIPR